MTGIASVLRPWALVVDCLEPLGATADGAQAKAQALMGAIPGVECFGRYLHNLTAAEVAGIHAAGASILPLIYAPSDAIGSSLGSSIGQSMTAKAMSLGLPPGVSVVVDLEAEHGTAADVAAYAGEVAALVKRFGWRPAAYSGAPQVLDGQQLFALPVEPYWRGGSSGLPEPRCSWALIQSPKLDQTVAGQRIDVSWHCVDAEGRAFTVWAPPLASERETQPEGLPNPPDAPDSPGP